jgi:hypothetical protein
MCSQYYSVYIIIIIIIVIIIDNLVCIGLSVGRPGNRRSIAKRGKVFFFLRLLTSSTLIYQEKPTNALILSVF